MDIAPHANITSDPETVEATPFPAGCPLDLVLQFLAQRWLAHIVWTLGRNGEMRFGQLQRVLPGAVSARLLSLRLKQLEALGFVSRRDEGTAVPATHYALTDEGHGFNTMLHQIEVSAAILPLGRLLSSPPSVLDESDN